jgi:hypothetical protein
MPDVLCRHAHISVQSEKNLQCEKKSRLQKATGKRRSLKYGDLRQSMVFSPFRRKTIEIPMIPWDAGTKVETMLQRVRVESPQQKAIIINSEIWRV